ncbi:PapB/FocB family fimbrial expression transcriptional regulator [Pseudomonas sp. RP23018S]|uniref:PapB/FocB family fimbrial expression transcriptional regulator n=1 Tax=Pseudomonas sp. RP23018S TaxID=3096037 RepID=UPI003A0FF5C1
MVDTDSGVVAGMVEIRHFQLQLKGTSIRAPALIAALRAHLVDGVAACVAWTRLRVNMSQLSRRLDVIRAVHQRAVALSVFYQSS